MRPGRNVSVLICALLAALLLFPALPAERAMASEWVQVAKRGISEDYNRAQIGAQCSAVLDSTLYVGTEEHVAYGIGCQVWGWDGTEWSRASEEGFGDPENEAVSAIAAYDSTLYAGTFNLHGCQVWRHDGPGPGDWTLINNQGFGLGIQKLDSFAVFDDGNGERLYAGAGGRVCRWDGPGAADWTQVNEDGFGNTDYLEAASMIVADVGFGDELYVGTGESSPYGCQVWRYVGPDDWMQVNVDGFGAANPGWKRTVDSFAEYGSQLYAGVNDYTDGCGIWRYDGPDPDDWTMVSEDGFGDNGLKFASDLSVFDDGGGDDLYACTSNPAARVWRRDGPGTGDWTQLNTDGFTGDNNNGSYAMAAYDDGSGTKLYAGTSNWFEGCEVWSWDGADWTQINLDGFGEPLNRNVCSLAVYDGGGGGGAMLYAGTRNYNQGCEVWRYDGPDPGDWTQVNADGFGDPNNRNAECMAVYDDGSGEKLYVGTSNETDTWETTGCEVWSYDGSDWEQVNPDGFGSLANQIASSMAVYDDGLGERLYVGTNNTSGGCEVWRYDDPGTGAWFQVGAGGFGAADNVNAACMATFNDRSGEKLYTATYNDVDGCQVWRWDGASWEQINQDGFGDGDNYSAASMAVFDDGEGDALYAGTYKTSYGCEVWRYDTPGADDWTQVNSDGFGSGYNTDATSMAVYGGGLYAATYNDSLGCEVWKLTSQLTVTASVSGGGGAVSPASQQVDWDGQATIDLIPNEGYHVASITDNGVPAEIADPYVIENVQEDHIVVVTFAINTYSVTASVSGGHGKVSPATQQVNWGGTATVDLIPDEGYHVASITDNGVPAAVADPYVIKDVQKDHIVVVAFAEDEPPPVPTTTWYLAEGCTAGDFETWILVQNPGDDAVTIDITFMTGSGPVDGPQDFPVAPNSRTSFNAGLFVTDWDVSTKVEATGGEIICERAMYGGGRTWAHDSIGVTAPADTWYLAEGCTEGGMETWILVQNPGDDAVTVDLTFMTSSGPVEGPRGFAIPSNSRTSFDAGRFVTGWDVSTKVKATGGKVICERAMYGGGRTWAHDSIGVTAPADTWYLAEGCTEGGMETWVLVQNPGNSEVKVDLTFMTGSGPVDGPQDFAIPANSRTSFDAGLFVTGWDVSTKVKATGGKVICERAMYGNGRTWAHDSIGVTAPSDTWYLAEGCTEGGMETWILVQNPGNSEVKVDLTFMTGSGPVDGPQDFAIPANSRTSFDAGLFVTGWDVSTKVEATGGKVICERAMYGNGRTWAHDSIGVSGAGFLSGWKFCVDPGHGGGDAGAIGPTGLEEKAVNLDVSLMLRDLLEAQGAEVLMTREDDSAVSINQRWQMANDWEADRFISIHHNGVLDAGVNGTETWIHYDASPQAVQLAGAVQEELVDELGLPDRGVKRTLIDSVTDFGVLKYTYMPAVLTEASFITNPEEEQRLSGNLYLMREAGAIMRGICIESIGASLPSLFGPGT